MADKIVKLLREASAAYYNGGPLKMDDETYDGLIERLKQLDPDHPYLEEVGAPVQGAITLPFPMPSLDKIKPAGTVMPEGLTAPLSKQQLADLIRYLAELGK